MNVSEDISAGDFVSAGEQLGTHISDISYHGIAVSVNTPTGWKLVSFFSVMNDEVFQSYQDRGIQSREDVIISKEARDADPLICTGETFVTSGTLENWVILQ